MTQTEVDVEAVGTDLFGGDAGRERQTASGIQYRQRHRAIRYQVPGTKDRRAGEDEPTQDE